MDINTKPDNKQSAIRYMKYYCAKASFHVKYSPDDVYREWEEQKNE